MFNPEYGDMVVDAKFIGATFVFSTYPRPIDAEKIRAVVEGKL